MMKSRQKNLQNDKFGSFKPLLEGLPQINGIRIGLELAVKRAEEALMMEPDREKPESFYEVPQRKRLAIGGLGVDFPRILLLLEVDASEPAARRALELLKEHGASDEIRLASGILLERYRPQELPAVDIR